MAKKQQYRIRNWSDYNKSLVNRGSLTIWFEQDSIDCWYNTEHSGKPGRPQRYSDIAIQCCLTLKVIYKLPLRATQGLVNSLLQLMKLPLSTPDYSLLSIRQKTLQLKIPKQIKSSQPIHLVVDSTGLKVCGEGEWKVRQHGKDKRRSWVKLHLAVNEQQHTIEASLLTSNKVHDCHALPKLLEQINHDINQVTGDGIYDAYSSYMAVISKGGTPCFPPKKYAVRNKPIDEAHRLRNHAVSQVRYYDLKYWKLKNNYHRRSLVETAMYRFKQLLGNSVQARTLQRQACEVGIKCLAINKITSLGMPSYS